MTEAEIADHKEKVKKVMIDHLTTLGYPDIDDDTIMRELKPMWIKIEEAGLKVDGMSYEMYCAYANDAFMMSQVRDVLGI